MLTSFRVKSLIAAEHVAVADRLQHFLRFLLRHLAILRGVERDGLLLLIALLRFFLTGSRQLALRRFLALLLFRLFAGRASAWLLLLRCAG